MPKNTETKNRKGKDMAKTKALAQTQSTQIQKSEKVNMLFGSGRVQIPVDAPLPQITIMRESAQFEMPDGRYEKEFTGHILHWHNANQYYSTAFGESESPLPDCCSSDGISPDGGTFKQPGPCRTCELNKFGSAADGTAKACQNTIRLYVLTDGEVIPSVIKAPPSSLGKKDSLMRWLTCAANTAARAGMGTHYQPIQVRFSLRKKEFSSGMNASVICIETMRVLDVDADAVKLAQLGTLYQDFMATYLGRIKEDVLGERSAASLNEELIMKNAALIKSMDSSERHGCLMRLFKHQQAAFERAKTGNLALFHECGTGKTLTALTIIRYWKSRFEKGLENGRWNGALVVCPLSIIEPAWMDDCRRFAPDLRIVSLWSKDGRHRQSGLGCGADVCAVNFETFRNMFEEISKNEFSVIVVDESSRMKSPDSQTTGALLALAGLRWRRKGKKFAAAKPVPHRYILSGTPAPNDRSEYWAQINFIAPNAAFADNFYAFRSRYFTAKPLGRTGINIWTFTKDPVLSAEFAERMSPHCDVVHKADAVDLPEQIHAVRKVELSKPERSAYETFRKELVLRFAREDVLAASALTEVMKARQLTSGFCYGSTGAHVIGRSKMNELLELRQEIGSQPIIVWCSFRQEIEELLGAVPKAAVLWGQTKDRREVIEGFKSGRYTTLIANPQSAGHGLTFAHCSYAVYYSLSWSYELMRQSQDRIHRIGQKNKCTYIYLLAKDTIDEVIYEALQKKKDLSDAVLRYLKQN